MTTLSPLNRPVSCSHIYQPTSKTEITVGGVVVVCWKEQQQAAHSTWLYFYITSDDYKKKHRPILFLFSNLSYVSSQIYLKDPGSHATGFIHWWGFCLKNSEYYFPACCSMYTRKQSTLYCHGADQYNCRRRRVCVADASSSADEMEKHKGVYIYYTLRGYIPPPLAPPPPYHTLVIICGT
jgi:hypothetical protein